MVSTAQILGKRKRMSKKNKKAWRKHTKIDDVEKFLEEKLQEERMGGDPAKKDSTALYYIDKSDLFETAKSKLSHMKCHSMLQIDTKVPPTQGYTGPKKRKMRTNNKPTPTPMSTSVKPKVYDIWSSNTKLDTKKLDPCLPLPVIAEPQYKVSESKVPAVELPHPGASYNPTFSSHQELLQSALDVEVQREKEKEKIARNSVPLVIITEDDYIKEMSVGLNKTGAESESDIEPATDITHPPVQQGRKTKSQRNKEIVEKIKEKQLKAAKLDKQRTKEFLRIKSVHKEIRREEKEQNTTTELRQAKKEVNSVRPGKYGPGKYVERQPDFQLPEEVSSSLRRLEPQGHTLSDRYLSLQRRNMIEVRKQVAPHRKYKLKYVEKWRMKLPEELKELTKTKHKPKKKIKMAE